LVTGAGFLGAYVARALMEKGYEVVMLDSQVPQEGSIAHWLLNRVERCPAFVKGDITDLATIIRTLQTFSINGIIHTAALTDVRILAESPIVSLRVNTLGSVNVLEAARLLGIKRVIMASSIAAYAPVKYEPIDEAHPVLCPESGPALTSYSTSKVAMESFGMHYWAQYGVEFIAFRFSGIYGFGMRYPLYIKPVVDAVVNGEKLDLGAVGDAVRDLVYVEDAARAMVLALEANEKQVRSRILNCGVGKMYSVIDIVNTMKGIEPDSKIKVAPGITDEERVIQKSRGRLSIERAKKQLGFEPAYSLEKGLKAHLELQRTYLKWLNTKSDISAP